MLLGSGGVDGNTTSIVTSAAELASASLVSAAATLAPTSGADAAGEADALGCPVTLEVVLGAREVPLARGGRLTRAGATAVEGSCDGRLSRGAAGEGAGAGDTRLGRSAVTEALGSCGGLLRRTPGVVPLVNGLCCVLVRAAGAAGKFDVLCGSLPADVGAVDVLCGVSLRCATGGL